MAHLSAHAREVECPGFGDCIGSRGFNSCKLQSGINATYDWATGTSQYELPVVIGEPLYLAGGSLVASDDGQFVFGKRFTLHFHGLLRAMCGGIRLLGAATRVTFGLAPFAASFVTAMSPRFVAFVADGL
jgi:hypothetical protein